MFMPGDIVRIESAEMPVGPTAEEAAAAAAAWQAERNAEDNGLGWAQ